MTDAPPISALFLVPALPIGGAERQIAALVAGLNRRRFRPIVACEHSLGPVAEGIAANGIPVHLLSSGKRRDPRLAFRVASLARRERIQIVLSHGFSTGVAARVGGWLGGVPVRVLAEHSTGERDMSPGRHRVNRLLNSWTSGWIAVAHGQQDYLVGTKGIPAERIRVIPNGIDSRPYRPAGARARIRAEFGLPEDARVAGMLAVLRPEKDTKTFLLAARFVADELAAARFLLVGDGPERSHLESEVQALNLADRVVFAGRRDDVPDVLTAFDVSVLCSTDVETFPMAFLESMATGLPLIGTRVGGLPEMIEDGRNGLLVRPRDPRGLADAMLRVLTDPERSRAWGETSRQRVESEFSLETMVDAYEEYFEELLARKGITLPGRDAPAAG